MKKIYSVVIVLSLLLLPGKLFAQSDGIGQDGMMIAIATLIVFTILVLVAVIISLNTLQKVMKQDRMAKMGVSGIEVLEEESWLSVLYRKLWGYKPISPWWKYLFIISVIFGIGYLLLYQVFDIMPSQTEEYDAQMAEANEQAIEVQEVKDEEGGRETVIAFTDDPTDLANGKNTYDMQCAACHLMDGGGIIGPNLTDEYWIHGGSMADIYNTIKVGVPDKGMIPWEAVLSPEQIRDVASYILTMQGTTPANPKAPQGEKY